MIALAGLTTLLVLRRYGSVALAGILLILFL
jgi:hypothetical protein